MPRAPSRAPTTEPPHEPFRSILFPGPAPQGEESAATLRDLNLDQLIDAVVAGRQEYDLRGFFLQLLDDPDAIAWRHEVFRDLEDPRLLELLRGFAGEMRAMREHLTTSDKLYYKEQKDAWLVHATEIYIDSVEHLAEGLASLPLRSRGLLAFREHVRGHAQSAGFLALKGELQGLQQAITQIRYCLRIHSGSALVRRYEGEEDYAAAVTRTFARFRQRDGKDYQVKFHEHVELNHIEAAVLAKVARLHPEAFAALAAFAERHRRFADERIVAFDREIQLYLAYLDHTAPLRRAGLAFCYPALSPTSKAVCARDAFDLALASGLVRDGREVVGNDLELDGPERMIVVSGPNQGGKTTFARIFGQLHYLARLGLPVPGREAKLLLCDHIFTHFEQAERVENLRGKLEDDLLRIHAILERATASSVIVLNEIFTSTSLQDAVFLGRQVLGRILRLDALCVCVTFVDELAELGPGTVSMVSTVLAENPAVRTFKIVRRPADGLAYAMTLAEKYRLTYESLRARIGP